jgi:hypothetical protein
MKIDLVFLLVIFIFAIYYLGSTKNVEKMSNVSNDIKEGIRQVYLADVDAIRNLSEVAKKLQTGGITNPGNLRVNGEIQTPGGNTIRCDGRQHIMGEELLYILNKSGVVIGKEWGGNGNLQVQGNAQVNGNTQVNGDVIAGAGVVSNNVILNGQDLGGPSTKTRINAQGIIFGGANNGREGNSAQISAGRHEADSLCIVGMSNPQHANRKITMWAEGGAKLYGDLFVNNRNILAELNDINNKINDIYKRGFFEGQKGQFRSYDTNRWLSEINGGAEVRGHRGVWSQFNIFHA